MAITGSDIIVEALVSEGVDVVFGYPGGCVLDIFDAMEKKDGLRTVIVRHEQAAGHMADGYARSTGRCGCVLATSGPGATNLVTALATAYADSVPMVALTGQVPSHAIGTDAFQEADVVGITRPCTKHNYLVRDIADLGRTIKEAFYIARSGRPGPVLIDIPKDVQNQTLPSYKHAESVKVRSYHPEATPSEEQIQRAIKAIAKAKRPLLYCGGGAVAADCQAELIELAERCDIPVTTTLLGLGCFPETHPNAMHMLGMHGTQYANYAMHNADLVMAVGARFDDRVTGKMDAFAPNREQVIHIDIDPTSISKCVAVSIPVIGDCKEVLTKILAQVEPMKHEKWMEQVTQWKTEHPLTYDHDDKLRPQYVIETLQELTKGEAIVATEVGQHQMWTAQFWKFDKPRTFLSSGGLGTMGYGFPASLGAQVAHPESLVVNIAGDGSIQMNIQELATAVMEKLPVKVIILNNGYLGMVRQWQELFYDKLYAGTVLSCAEEGGTDFPYIPDFVKLCEAYGAVGIRVDKKDDVRGALKDALGNGKTTFIEFRIEREENVWPMIPAGKSVEESISGLA